MSTSEVWTNDFGFYEIQKREIKDDYTLRKSQHDRRKLRDWLNALLVQNDLVIWYEENGEEKMIIGTLIDMEYYDVLDLPVTIERYRGRTYLECYHITCLTLPTRKPILLHVDSIRKYLLANHKIKDISNKVFAV